MSVNPEASSPAVFMPALQDYLVAKLKIVKARIHLDVAPQEEIKAADGKTVALFLGGPVPYISPNSGAGRHSEQICRRLLVRIATFNSGDTATNRVRLNVAQWNFEDAVFNALQKMTFKPWFVCPPFLETSSPEATHMKTVAGGVETSLTFVLTYIPTIEQGQP